MNTLKSVPPTFYATHFRVHPGTLITPSDAHSSGGDLFLLYRTALAGSRWYGEPRVLLNYSLSVVVEGNLGMYTSGSKSQLISFISRPHYVLKTIFPAADNLRNRYVNLCRPERPAYFSYIHLVGLRYRRPLDRSDEIFVLLGVDEILATEGLQFPVLFYKGDGHDNFVGGRSPIGGIEHDRELHVQWLGRALKSYEGSNLGDNFY